MDAEKLAEAVKQRPFSPVRILLSDGSHYDITHPDQLMVTRRWSYVGVGGNGESFYEDNAVIDNLHVTRIEPLRPAKKGKAS
ncbi:MAG: hypothetical protein V1790_02380 [Planctomycetota bacterium]|jgi:hypothetical protein